MARHNSSENLNNLSADEKEKRARLDAARDRSACRRASKMNLNCLTTAGTVTVKAGKAKKAKTGK